MIKARVLLDSASQRTFMTNKLAQKLKLPSEHKEYLSVSTFGATKATNLETYVVNFKVKIKDGSYMSLSANVLKQITGCIQRSPLLQKDLEFLKFIPQNELADQIPNTLESLDVDILIGSDFFWNIVGGDKIVLPSGMFMLPSKFGYIVTGKSPNNQNVQGKHAHALFVTTEVNPVVSELCLQCCVSSPTASVSTGNKPQLENLWSLEMIRYCSKATSHTRLRVCRVSRACRANSLHYITGLYRNGNRSRSIKLRRPQYTIVISCSWKISSLRSFISCPYSMLDTTHEK